jgi:hypothetical protein
MIINGLHYSEFCNCRECKLARVGTQEIEIGSTKLKIKKMNKEKETKIAEALYEIARAVARLKNNECGNSGEIWFNDLDQDYLEAILEE